MPASAFSPRALAALVSVSLVCGFGAACGSSDRRSPVGAGAGGPTTSSGDGGISFVATVSSGSGQNTAVTCQEAAEQNSYIGCDFWPTVTANNVWSLFDFAVVVANATGKTVDATVERGGTEVASVSIPANSLETIYLPWVPELKGPDADSCGSAVPLSSSVKVADGAYHLTTDAPVTVYQFNALEYAPQGGPPGKSWAGCPGDQVCPQNGNAVGCFSFTNDASLLLPSSAMTGNYRVMAWPGWTAPSIGTTLSITATEDGTDVTVNVSSTGQILGGNGISSASANGSTSFTLDAGEVAELVGAPSSDLSGSLVTADKPVQVITGMPCAQVPLGTQACDHLEESNFPAETLGQRYFVTRPASPTGQIVGHVVRFYGNVDDTTLSYPNGAPAGAPTSLDAGEVVDVGVVDEDFEVVGDAAFAVGTYLLGGEVLGASGRGDPAQSFATAVEQYRTRYIFLAPTDYDTNFVFVTMPLGATLTLDGDTINADPTPIGDAFGIARVSLSDTMGGAHELVASEPVGIQVAGYGLYTSYFYPGGSDLVAIAPPPVK